jgi:hypothetical protein
MQLMLMTDDASPLATSKKFSFLFFDLILESLKGYRRFLEMEIENKQRPTSQR